MHKTYFTEMSITFLFHTCNSICLKKGYERDNKFMVSRDVKCVYSNVIIHSNVYNVNHFDIREIITIMTM